MPIKRYGNGEQRSRTKGLAGADDVDDRVRSPNTLRCVTATTSLSISPSSPEEPVTLSRGTDSRRTRNRKKDSSKGDLASIRKTRFAFPCYRHASNYMPSKAASSGAERVRRRKGGGAVEPTPPTPGERVVVASVVVSVLSLGGVTGAMPPKPLRDLQPGGESRANKSPQLPPVRAICLDGRLMLDIIHAGNNTLLPNEV
ncbi:hypothetical protein KPH14_006286 [Odynerus spinipes]|uniref:Uncharacterized protein n=1 Tax=Odynerus spinipes TaxID=1348599 RepID=A0AAD9RSE0_9HYME|nr:hypothetical protein KPH14_006286 [Odynerus spinipes]